MTDYITNKIERTLKISNIKRTGEDQIKKAKENGEDVAVLSTSFNFDKTIKPEKFSCALGKDCLNGDHTKITPGNMHGV